MPPPGVDVEPNVLGEAVWKAGCSATHGWRRRPAHKAGIAAAALILMLASCTSTAPTGRPAPTTEPSAPDGGTNGAPRVATPLDATHLLDRPCATLSDDQLTGFGVGRAGEPDPGGSGVAKTVGPSCEWSAEDGSRNGITITWYTEGKTGLANHYDHRDEAAYFMETTVDRYPAVFVDWQDLRDAGSCAIVVGVSDTLTFGVTTTGELDTDACDRTKQVAAAVIQNLLDR